MEGLMNVPLPGFIRASMLFAFRCRLQGLVVQIDAPDCTFRLFI
jgi:hypothetical protein